MSRIRSLHPTQWTDEEFVACSPLARLLGIALRNEADDRGVFEWKPLTIKMRLLPGDNCDVNELLDELIVSKQVIKFEAEGKQFGFIRNFTTYQRPKKPVYRYPVPPEFPTGTEPFPQKAEFGPQMEDVGEGEESPLPPSRGFDEFWNLYPHKVQEDEAREAYDEAEPEVGSDVIMGGLKRYIATKPPTVNWKKPALWLRGKRWKDHPAKPDAKPIALVHSGPKRTFAEIKEAEAKAKRATDPPSGMRPISSITPTVLLPIEGAVS